MLPGEEDGEYYGFPPSKQYVFAGPPAFPFRGEGFEPLASFAQGGLAEAWTGGCYPFDAEEIADWPVAFEELVGALGIDGSTPVVVYDAGRSQMAGLVAWAFHYYGHPDTRHLDGGLAKWTAEGLPLSSDAPAHEPRTFAARPVDGVYCCRSSISVRLEIAGLFPFSILPPGRPPPAVGRL